MRAVGIDFGNNNSRVGVWQRNHIEIIPNELGSRITPSCVAFTETERSIGSEAKNKMATNPHNTLYNVRRLIARRYDDNEVQLNIKNLPFIVSNKYGKPFIQVEYQYETKLFAPEEITSMILSKMKNIAEAFLGETVSEAVITLGGLHTDSLLQSIRDAATISGLSTLSVIPSTSSAAIAYALEKKPSGTINVLIFDMGSGTTDVSLVNISDLVVEVMAIASDTHLGGNDFDSRLVNHYVQVFEHKYRKNISNNVRALSRLRTACERAKCALSISSQATIEIDSLFENIDFYTIVTRSKFEELNDDLFHMTIETVKKVLQDADMDKSNVDEIILVGGSSRVPKIQSLISDFFNGKELNKSINPDEAMAYGAAVNAAILSGNTSKKIEKVLLVNVAPLTLGIETAGGTMLPIIKRNTMIPTKKVETFPTNSTHIVINVYEGDSQFVKDNHFLGKILFDVPPTYNGSSSIEVTLDIDSNRLIIVTVKDCTSGKWEQLTITNDDGRLSNDELARMIADSERYCADDERIIQRMEAHNKLEGYVYKLRNLLQDKRFSSKFSPIDIERFNNTIQETITWFDDNQEAGKHEYDYKREILEKIFYPVTSICEKGFFD
ncbi:14816_t:CDS:2 [Entrophospora sp. SA101]|nr:14816_t:CDS:2 [Entrophospora sp. SA101]